MLSCISFSDQNDFLQTFEVVKGPGLKIFFCWFYSISDCLVSVTDKTKITRKYLWHSQEAVRRRQAHCPLRPCHKWITIKIVNLYSLQTSVGQISVKTKHKKPDKVTNVVFSANLLLHSYQIKWISERLPLRKYRQQTDHNLYIISQWVYLYLIT